MPRYNPGDIVTYYFIIRDDSYGKIIKGWTDQKLLAEFYMKFHNCKSFTLKKLTATIEEINDILRENHNDEISIVNILVRDQKRKGEMKSISIPATTVEMDFINDEDSTMFYGRIDYGYLNEIIPYFKDKYLKALSKLLLPSMIKKAVYNRSDKFNTSIQLDQLMVLVKHFPNDFG